MKKLLLILALGGLALALSSSACSSSSGGSGSTPCNENPWECATGQTCWLKDQNTFACLKSGPGKLGDPCTPIAGAAECADGLLCFAGAGTTTGVCTSYCDSSHGCPTGEQCVPAMFAGSSAGGIELCYGTAPMQDAGSEAGPEAGPEGGGQDASQDATTE